MTTLFQRLTELKENQNTSTKSDSKEATPLAVFLHLYSKARTACYVDNMKGAKILYKWLAPITIPSYPTIKQSLPSFIIGYEHQELAKLLIDYKSANQLAELQQVELAIFAVVCNEFTQELSL